MQQTEINLINKIRNDYEEKRVTKIDELKVLNKKVYTPARVFAYIFGSISSLILGFGMCLAMKVIFADLVYAMPIGIVIGLLGILLVSINYPIYKAILKSRKRKYQDKIFALSDEILNIINKE